VILVDANILIYASIPNFAQHRPAARWLDQQLGGTGRVGLPWESLIAFLRVSTNPRLFPRSATMSEAWRQVQIWLACEPVWIPLPTERHADVLATVISTGGVHAKLVHDAHLAALAIEHGLTLYSTDSDFARFTTVSWVNPLST
jgi:toxin-antitoxin system PIN domain toxin